MSMNFDECKQRAMAIATQNPKTMLKSATSVFWILENKYPYDDKAKNKRIYSKLFAEQNADELKRINKSAIIQKIDTAFNNWEKPDITHYTDASRGAMELIFTQYSVTVNMFGILIDDANKLLDVMWKLGFVNYIPDTNEAYIDDKYYDKPIENMAFECKSCGGEIKKDGNAFVCQKCGEVFKNEHVIEHGNSVIKSKTPKINMDFSEEKTERLNNLYTIARRSKENDDSKQAEKYYDMILVENPNSWEAVFYATYFSVAQCKIGEIGAAADKLTNCLNSVFDLIDTYADSSEESTAITEVYTKTKSFAELLYYNAKNHYSQFKDTSNSISEFLTRCNLIYLLLCELGDQLEKRYTPSHEIEKMCVDAWKKGIEIRLNYRFWDEESKQKILSYSDKVKKYDSSYQGVNFNSGGCYVATCVYGSYDCPEVWTLRRYRDYTLAETWYGRAFIKTYYAISPTIVKCFGNTYWFKKLWREKLDKMVDKLNGKGIENTPYNDRR